MAAIEPEEYFEWASIHDVAHWEEPYVQATGRDEKLARIRVAYWRESLPDAPTRLMRRKITINYGDWEEVPDETA